MKYSNTILLTLILFIAAVLRFFHIDKLPFTHDEFSMLFRTSFSSFLELIEKGVIVDTHPAGIQVFVYYWIKIFGASTVIVKFPFLIFGLCSVFLIYEIGKRWYNESVGLIAAAYMASLQYPIMYSQIARPYISGLFFSLLMVYYWTKIILIPEKHKYLNSVLFIFSALLCAYNHHISLLFAFIVGVTGVFLVKKEFRRNYLLAGLVIFLFYLPHINIFILQLKMGGVEAWLGKPNNDFFIKYVAYIFHYSIYCLLLAGLIFLLGYKKITKKYFRTTPFKLALIWFALPFLISFFYSLFVSSILQFSILIFSFPFFLLLLFGHLPKLEIKYNYMLVFAILFVNSITLIVERRHFEIFYTSVYEELLMKHDLLVKKNRNVVSVIDSDKEITSYFIEKNKADSNFVYFDSFSSEKKFILFLQKKLALSDTLYLGVSSGNKPNTVSLVMNYFPFCIEKKDFFNGTAYTFVKTAPLLNSLELNYFTSLMNFNNKQLEWDISPFVKKMNSTVNAIEQIYMIDSTQEFGPFFNLPLKEVLKNKNDFIDLSVDVLLDNDDGNPLLTASLERAGTGIYWGGENYKTFYLDRKQEWVTMYFSIKLSDIKFDKNKTVVKLGIWNKNLDAFKFKNFIVKFRRGNSILYGFYEAID